MREFTINNNDSGQRIDKFLSKAMPELPKSMMYRLIRKKDIKLNGKRCEASALLSEGDVLRVYVKDEVAAAKSHDMSFKQSSDDLQIVYEDSNILVLFKPVGVDSHPNVTSSADTLIDRVKKYLWRKGEYVPEEESSFAPALCSRLDRNTAGLVTAAKTAAALREVNAAIKSGDLHKIYRCVTVSAPPTPEAVATAYHRKDEDRNIVRISDAPADGFREIRTGWRTVAEKGGLYLLEVTLYTGRTHQIRAHFAHLGAPLLGDGKYGDIRANKRYGVFRQQLCAYALEFSLPEGSPLAYLNCKRITAPAPEFEERFR
ncbi:MAG: RluA family pseudouridine synthase [Ruminococcus sp.]|nr:RluA family pseudouridine synthase [Ruminococcus sp.]